MPSYSDQLLADVLVEGQILSQSQIDRCLALIEDAKGANQHKALGDVILEEKLLSEQMLRNSFDLLGRFPVLRLKKGEKLGPYQVLEYLGRGGMGPCYEVARSERPQATVMLKVLPSGLSCQPEIRERFFRQVIKAMGLRHENIANVYEADVDGDLCYVVQELVPGQPLGTVLDHLPMLDETQARELVVQTALALRHASAHGLSHGNLKPNNIILSPSGLVKVNDFGMASFSGWGEVLTRERDSWGAPYYASPEHGQPSTNIDLRSDIYSLGVIFYEMLTGAVPFSGKIPILDLRRQMNEEWPDPRGKNRSVSDEVVQVIARMTARNPSERYQSVEELLEDLEVKVEPEFAEDSPQSMTTEELKMSAEKLSETKIMTRDELFGNGNENVFSQDGSVGNSPPSGEVPAGPPQVIKDGTRELIALFQQSEKEALEAPTPVNPSGSSRVGVSRRRLRGPADEENRSITDDANSPSPAPESKAFSSGRIRSRRLPGPSPLVIAVVSAVVTALVFLFALFHLGFLKKM